MRQKRRNFGADHQPAGFRRHRRGCERGEPPRLSPPPRSPPLHTRTGHHTLRKRKAAEGFHQRGGLGRGGPRETVRGSLEREKVQLSVRGTGDFWQGAVAGNLDGKLLPRTLQVFVLETIN